MVVVMTDKAISTEVDVATEIIDGRNAYNASKWQAIMGPKLSSYVETWYLSPSPLWFYMDDNTLAIIWSLKADSKVIPCLPSYLLQFINQFSR